MRRSYRAIGTWAIGLWMATAGIALAEVTTQTSRELRVLGQLRESLSPNRDVLSIRALRTVGTIEMQGREIGRMETVAERDPRRMRDVLDLEGVHIVITVVGDEAWMEDNNGAVRPLTGGELSSVLLAHELLFHDYLDGASPPFTLDVSEREIRFVPPHDGPSPRLLLSDTETALLPLEWSERQQGLPVVTKFADWRETEGILFPFEARQETGDPRFDMTRLTTSVELLDGLGDDAIVPPSSTPVTDAILRDPERARAIEIDVVENLVFVRADVNELTNRMFLLDTGAGSTILSRELVEQLRLESRGLLQARGAGGSEEAAYVELGSLRLPGIEMRDQTVISLSLEALRSAFGRRIDGILGYDLLSRFAVEIDYPNRTLALLPPGTYSPPEGATRIPLTIEANVPRIQGRVEDLPEGLFILDTGNARTLFLHTPFVERHGLGVRARGGHDWVSGIGGEELTRGATIHRLTLGDLELHDVSALFSSAEIGVLSLDEAIGNVGGALFSRGVLAFDYSEGAAWVRRPDSAASASGR